jgi:hypothetical protein
MVTYWRKWSGHGKRAQENLTAEKARLLHDKGEEYVVVMGDPTKPSCYLDVVLKRDHIALTQLDSQLRGYDWTAFGKMPDGRFLIKESTYRRYDGGTDTVIFAQFMSFKPNGAVRIVESFVDRGTRREANGMNRIDDFYVDPPKFGDYDSFFKFGKDGAFDPRTEFLEGEAPPPPPPPTREELERIGRIRDLNDAFRKDPRGLGRVDQAPAVGRLGRAFIDKAVAAAASYDSFPPDRPEHNGGSIVVNGHPLFFSIMYMDRATGRVKSPDPSDPNKTLRELLLEYDFKTAGTSPVPAWAQKKDKT